MMVNYILSVSGRFIQQHINPYPIAFVVARVVLKRIVEKVRVVVRKQYPELSDNILASKGNWKFRVRKRRLWIIRQRHDMPVNWHIDRHRRVGGERPGLKSIVKIKLQLAFSVARTQGAGWKNDSRSCLQHRLANVSARIMDQL